MPGGRPKTPPQLKVLNNTFRKDRDTHGAASSKKIGAPACPSWLPKSAKKYWKQIAEELSKAGLISVLDQAAFSAHCDSVGKFEEVTRKLKTIDDLVDKTPNNLAIQSAMFTIRNKLWDQVIKSSTEFGLTPSGASKIKATNQEQLPLDGFDDL